MDLVVWNKCIFDSILIWNKKKRKDDENDLKYKKGKKGKPEKKTNLSIGCDDVFEDKARETRKYLPTQSLTSPLLYFPGNKEVGMIYWIILYNRNKSEQLISGLRWS